MTTQVTYPIWWNKTIVDFVTPEEAEKTVKDNPNARLIEYIGQDGTTRKGLLITTPLPQWRTIMVK